MNDLTQLTTKEALAIFTGDGLDNILAEIKTDAENFVANIDSANGRRAIKSKAREVASKKVKLDAVGKELVTDWKQKAKLVDNARKKSRDFLDEVRDEVRKPLTDWEEAENKRIEAEAEAAELEALHAEAIEANIFFDEKKDIECREAEVKAREEEAKEAERKRQEDADREAREKKIAEDVKKEAEIEIARVQARVEQEKQDAVETERRRNEAIETTRKHSEQLVKDKAERRAANVKHREKVNKEVISSFMAEGCSIVNAETIMLMISVGKINHVTINY